MPATNGSGRAEPTLRERKKRETRKRISDAATALIIARGFDSVTVAEIAEAAGVSAMTVFNYFPRKEDLFLDRIPEAVELFSSAVLNRPDGETPLAALRRLALELLDQRSPLAAVGDTFPRHWQVVIDSAALRARAREGLDEIEHAVEAAIRRTTGPEEADPAMTAALAIAAYRTVYLATARRLLAGERADDLVEDHRLRVHRAFDAVERGLPAGR
ncbi:TetR/AcrR family transcriptional regulator [Kitasatospora sp. HPMI-4]|uniref:TetR/AcrR family transcriptional regulator n=1 Tax=Kitasatospora sp. HPMI-4 TaxID=3448443 RepID=UPI003F1A686D